MLRTLAFTTAFATIGALSARGSDDPGGHGFQALTGKVVLEGCRADVCSWFSIEDVSFVGESSRGALFRFTVKEWESTHPHGSYGRVTDRRLTGTLDEYALCSKTLPAVIAKSGSGQWTGRLLFPERQDRISEKDEAPYRRYWAMCHSLALNDVSGTGSHLATALGYRSTPEANGDERPLPRPEDALLW